MFCQWRRVPCTRCMKRKVISAPYLSATAMQCKPKSRTSGACELASTASRAASRQSAATPAPSMPLQESNTHRKANSPTRF